MIIDQMNPEALGRALDALRTGQVFVYPTDTLYGFGGDACSEEVLDALYDIKKRPGHMPVSMIVRDQEMLDRYAKLSPLAIRLIEAFLPGPLTLVLPAKNNDMPDKLFSEKGYLGFRMPDHDLCKKMSENFDRPIITTSVNLSGQAAMKDIKSIEKVFGDHIDLLICDESLEKQQNGTGSTVVMLSSKGSVKILREGAIPSEAIIRLQ